MNYIEKFTGTQQDKIQAFGDGPWVKEPDYVSFEHADMECLILRTGMTGKVGRWFGGHLCGYVAIPDYHPLFEKDYFGGDYPTLDVHGGVTFSNHLSYYGKFRIGFDCAHMNDISPSIERHIQEGLKDPTNPLHEINKRLASLSVYEKTYKDISYAIGECKSLAEQVALYKKE